jgi:hypothetical protein
MSTLMRSSAANRRVRCPACGGDSLYSPDNPFRPFCCERCKNLDLGAWANEGFRVPADMQTEATQPPCPEGLP